MHLFFHNKVSVLNMLAFISGGAALLYQATWMKLFSIHFGSSEVAVAFVLGGFMSGLAVGAALSKYFLPRISRYLLAYAFLEIAIAVSALLSPGLIEYSSRATISLLGAQSGNLEPLSLTQALYSFVASFMIIGVPACFMGATLPVLLQHLVQRQGQIGPYTAIIYAANTFGGVAGVIGAGFFLIPGFGLAATIVAGAALNLLVAIMAIIIQIQGSNAKHVNSRFKKRDETKPDDKTEDKVNYARIKPIVFTALFACGLLSFVGELFWFRLLSHVLGSSLYSFSTMLATFLAGIALGGGMAMVYSKTPQDALRAMPIAFLFTSAFTAITFLFLSNTSPGSTTLLHLIVYAMIILLPSTVSLGLIVPLAVRIITALPSQSGGSIANVYFWNTIGAIAGSSIGALFILPRFGFSGTLLLLGAGFLLLAITVNKAPRNKLSRSAISLGSVFCIALMIFSATTPFNTLGVSTLRTPAKKSEIVFDAVGVTSTVAMIDRPDHIELRTNGLPEADIALRHALPALNGQVWLGLLPSLARPEADMALIIGLGGGNTVGGLSKTLERIDIVEIEPEIINANAHISGRRKFDPLSQENVSIVANDARAALRRANATWDIIISQPSHPWTRGASNLYTHEFIELAKERLTADGVFIQWINSVFVDEAVLKDLVRTVADSFGNITILSPNGSTIFVLASDQEIVPDLLKDGKIDILLAREAIFRNPGQVSSFILADDDGARRFAADASRVTDNFNRMETKSRWRGDGLRKTELMELLAPYRFDPRQYLGEASDCDRANAYLFYYDALTDAEDKAGAELFKKSVEDICTRTILEAYNEIMGDRPEQAAQTLTSEVVSRSTSDVAQALYLFGWPNNSWNAPYRTSKANIGGFKSKTIEAIYRGVTFAEKGDWRRIELMDADFENVSADHILFPIAKWLQAYWRIEGAENGKSELLNEAQRIIDQSLIQTNYAPLLLLRYQAARKSGDQSIAQQTRIGGLKRLTAVTTGNESELAQLTPAKFSEIKYFQDQICNQEDLEADQIAQVHFIDVVLEACVEVRTKLDKRLME